MADFTIYDIATGEILRNISIPTADISLNINAGEAYEQAEYLMNDYYMSTGSPPVATLKQTQPISWDKTAISPNGSDTATASNVVAGSQFKYTTVESAPAPTTTINDGTVALSSNVNNTTKVKIDAGFKYLPYTQDITVL